MLQAHSRNVNELMELSANNSGRLYLGGYEGRMMVVINQ